MTPITTKDKKSNKLAPLPLLIRVFSTPQLEVLVRSVNPGVKPLGVHLPSHQTHLPLLFVCRTSSPRICPVPLQSPVRGGDDRATRIWTGIAVHMSSPVAAHNRRVRVPLLAPIVPTSVTPLELTDWFDLLRWWQRECMSQCGGLWPWCDTGLCQGGGSEFVYRCVWVPSNSLRSRFIRQIGWCSRALRANWRGIKLDPQSVISNFQRRERTHVGCCHSV